MSRDKQFDEHLDLTDTIHMSGYGLLWEDCTDIAHQIQDQGYRKASDLAEEIFEEIDREICLALESNYKARDRRQMIVIAHGSSTIDRDFIEYVSGKIDTLRGINDFLAELKKKYIGEDRDKLAEFSKYSPLSWKYTESENNNE